MPNQTEAGKAFEYSLLTSAYNYLSSKSKTEIIKNSSYDIAKNCYMKFNKIDRKKYDKCSLAAIEHIILLEPILTRPQKQDDLLEIQIVADNVGIKGDVRDVIFIRSKNNWEIGISAKNNHKAVKHSRLSHILDFGKEWFNIPCSSNYFNHIKPVFKILLKEKDKNWNELPNKQQKIYYPLLQAFKKEIMSLYKSNKQVIPKTLLSYLIGRKDFYKVIKKANKTEIIAFNIEGTLNRKAGISEPEIRFSKIKAPTRIIELVMKENSLNTLLLTCDGGWQFSFRIHNARTKIEPSLKFDINLIGFPQNLYIHHKKW